MDARSQEEREAQDGQPHRGVALGEREGVLLRLQLVTHPAERRVRLRPAVLGEEVRVRPARAVDRGEGAQEDVRHPGRGRRGHQVQRPDGFELVGVGGIPLGTGEEGGVNDRVHLLVLQDVHQALVGPGQGEVDHAMAHPREGRRRRGDVHRQDRVRVPLVHQPPQDARAQKGRGSGDGDAAHG